MRQTYYRESDDDGGAWKVALVTREHDDGTRDLLVFGKVGDEPKEVAGAAEYLDTESGWSDTQQRGNGRLELQAHELRSAVDAGEVDLPVEEPELAETEPAPAESEATEPSIDPAEFTVEELEVRLRTVEDHDSLAALYLAEKTGKDRVTALEAIEERSRELNEANEDLGGGSDEEE